MQTAAPINGFTTIMGITINPMVIVLALVIGVVGVLVWRAQRAADNNFDLLDLVMDGGKLSISKSVFLTAFLMTSWVIIDEEIKGALHESIFAAYLFAWVGPLVAKVVFNKADPPQLSGGK